MAGLIHPLDTLLYGELDQLGTERNWGAPSVGATCTYSVCIICTYIRLVRRDSFLTSAPLGALVLLVASDVLSRLSVCLSPCPLLHEQLRNNFRKVRKVPEGWPADPIDPTDPADPRKKKNIKKYKKINK